jgi:hypothetical protein
VDAGHRCTLLFVAQQPSLPGGPHSGLLLSRLLEEISATLMGCDRLASFARSIRRERDAAPRMAITVADGGRGRLLAETSYVGSPALHGTLEDALRIAGDLLDRGLAVTLQRTEEGIRVWVDEPTPNL